MRVARGPLRAGRAGLPISCELLERRVLLAAALPNLPGVNMPASNPALPAGFDTFTPPVTGTTPAAGGRAIAQWTQSAGPNDTLSISVTQPSALPASDDSSDTQFVTYGQTNSANGGAGGRHDRAAWIERRIGQPGRGKHGQFDVPFVGGECRRIQRLRWQSTKPTHGGSAPIRPAPGAWQPSMARTSPTPRRTASRGCTSPRRAAVPASGPPSSAPTPIRSVLRFRAIWPMEITKCGSTTGTAATTAGAAR